jgi:hypothetical protein
VVQEDKEETEEEKDEEGHPPYNAQTRFDSGAHCSAGCIARSSFNHAFVVLPDRILSFDLNSRLDVWTSPAQYKYTITPARRWDCFRFRLLFPDSTCSTCST